MRISLSTMKRLISHLLVLAFALSLTFAISLHGSAAYASPVSDKSTTKDLMTERSSGKAGVFSGEEDDSFSDQVRFSLRNSAYHFLNAIAAGKITSASDFNDLSNFNKLAPSAYTVLPNVKMAIARFNTDDPTDFTLCGWSTAYGSDKIAIIYRSDKDYFNGRFDCSPTSAELNSVPMDTVESDSIEPALLTSSIVNGIAPKNGETALANEPVPVDNPNKNNSQDLTTGLLIFLAFLGLFGLCIAGYVVSQKAKRGRLEHQRNVDGWETLIAKCDKITKEWSAYELDPVKILTMPLLSDMREPLTKNFHKSYILANNLRPSHIKLVSMLDPDGSPFAKAVNNLESSFRAAESEAKRVLWNNFSTDERKRLQRAKDLLNLAMNSGASDNERQSAYKRMMKELQGLIVIPNVTVLELEKAVNLMLTDGSENNSVILDKGSNG